MKTEGYIVNHLSTALVQVTAHSTSHSYIKVTHHEWNNSKEERFPLLLPRTPLYVRMQCCDHLKSFIQQKRFTHCKDRPSLLWNFQYRELRIMPVQFDCKHPPI